MVNNVYVYIIIWNTIVSVEHTSSSISETMWRRFSSWGPFNQLIAVTLTLLHLDPKPNVIWLNTSLKTDLEKCRSDLELTVNIQNCVEKLFNFEKWVLIKVQSFYFCEYLHTTYSKTWLNFTTWMFKLLYPSFLWQKINK